MSPLDKAHIDQDLAFKKLEKANSDLSKFRAARQGTVLTASETKELKVLQNAYRTANKELTRTNRKVNHIINSSTREAH